VVNQEKEPIEDVQVKIVGSNIGTLSNSRGAFSLDAGENDLLEFSHVSYETFYFTLGAQKPDTIVLNAGVHSLKEVEVLPFSSSDVLRIVSKSIDEIPFLFGEKDILKYAATLPGITSTSALDAGIYVRGGNSSENAYYVNDIYIANPRHITGILSAFDPYILNHSGLFKSGYPAKYNGYLSSYINMQPVSYSPSDYSGEVTCGLLASSIRSKIKLGKNDKTLAAFSFRNSYFQYAGKMLNRNSDEDKIPEYSFKDLTFSVRSELNSQWILETFGLITSDDLPLNVGEKSRHHLSWGTESFVLKTRGRLGDGHEIEISTGGNRFHSDASSQDRVSVLSTSENRAFSFQTQYVNTVREKLNYSVGVEGRFRSLIYKQNENQTVDESNYKYVLGSSFGELRYDLTGTVSVNAGINASVFENGPKYVSLAPRLKFMYKKQELALWLDYARTHQYETNMQVFTIASPVDRKIPVKEKPAVCDQISAGISAQPFSRLSFSSSVFYKYLDNIRNFGVMDRIDISLAEENMLSGKGKSKGAEFEVEYNTSRFFFRSNYTLSKVKHRFDEINDGRCFYPPYDIRHNVLANVAFNITPTLKFNALWEYKSGIVATFPLGVAVSKNIFDTEHAMQMVPIYGDRYNYRLKATHRLDINFSWEKQLKHGGVELNVGVYNVYDRDNPNFVYIDARPKDDYYIKFVPKSKNLLPLMPFLSVTYSIDH
jgi:outer membrane receptor protein involved in Fe transport